MIHEHFVGVQNLVPSSVTSFLYAAELSTPPKASDYPYVVLWGTPGNEVSGEPGDRAADGEIDQMAFFIRATYTGLSGEALSIVMGGTRAALNRARPTVDGWKPSKLTQTAIAPIEVDESIPVGSTHPVFAVDEYFFTSSRIPSP